MRMLGATDAFSEPLDLSLMCSRLVLNILFQGVGRRAEIASTHHSHERTEESVPALRHHFELVINLGLGAKGGEEKAMAAGHRFEMGDVPSTLVLVELLKGLRHVAEASNGHLELRPCSRSPLRHFSRTCDSGVPFHEIGH